MSMSSARRCALIFLLSIAAHLPGIRSPLLDYHYQRQTETATVARNYHELGVPFLSPRVNWNGNDDGHAATELPLYTWSVGRLWPLLGLGDLWGRLLSIFCSALTAAFVFLFLSGEHSQGAWMEAQPAFYAACLFSLIPIEIYFGRTVQPEAMSLLGTLVCLWALDRYLDAEKPSSTRTAGWILAVIGAAASIGLKIPYLYLLGVCAALAWSRRGPACLKDLRLWLWFPAVMAPVAAWYRYANSASAHLIPTSPSTLISMLDYSHHPETLFRYAYFLILSRFPELTTTYPGLLLFGLGMKQCLSSKTPKFLPLWWLCVWLYTLAGGGYTYQHEYTALPFAPINAAFMGLGLCVLAIKTKELTDIKSRRWARAGISALILGMPLHAGLRIHQWYRINFPFLLRIGPAVDQLSEKTDLFACNQLVPSLYLYFIDRRGWSWEVSREPAAKINAAIRSGAKYFLTAEDSQFSNPADPIARSFFSRFPVAYRGNGALIFRLTAPDASGYNTTAFPAAGNP